MNIEYKLRQSKLRDIRNIDIMHLLSDKQLIKLWKLADQYKDYGIVKVVEKFGYSLISL